MNIEPDFDPYFDFRAEANGKDADSHSPTLRRYHQLLWSKPLPDGTPFDLEDMKSRGYLCHSSDRGEFLLSSDTVSRTFDTHTKMQPILNQLSRDDRDDALKQGYSMGGMILFPGIERGGKTLNQVRGFTREVEDRFDITLECIRRQYTGKENELSEVLGRYWDFFSLFEDFRGYVDFFLLQDLVSDDYEQILFWSPWQDFSTPPLAEDLPKYLQYRERMLAWVNARARRMAGDVTTRLGS